MSLLDLDEISLNDCIDKLQQILQSNKTGVVLKSLTDVNHQYSDKFHVVEQVTGIFGSCVMNTLSEVILPNEHLGLLKSWQEENECVSLRVYIEQTCEFVKETTRTEDDRTQFVTEKTGLFNQKTVSKVVRTIKEYFYKLHNSYRIVAYKGYHTNLENPEACKVLLQNSGSQEIKLLTKGFPYPEKRVHHRDLEISWLLRRLSLATESTMNSFAFQIDRSKPTCYTPRRNRDVEEALKFVSLFRTWEKDLTNIFKTNGTIYNRYNSETAFLDVSWNVEDILMPVYPIVEDTSSTLVSSSSNEVAHEQDRQERGLNPDSVSRVLACHQLELREVLRAEEAKLSVKHEGSLISRTDVRIILCLKYLHLLIDGFARCMDSIETMLSNQLIAAIGKIVTPWDFGEYMKFHYRKVFQERYQPKEFSYAIRRSSLHSPEGIVRIELSSPTTPVAAGKNLLMTICRDYSSPTNDQLMEFAIDASTKIRFGGERYLHGWLGHSFSNDMAMPSLQFIAESRQFSSFIVLLGRVNGPKLFDPQHAFLVQNKDLMTIPLLLETLPTPKQFREAISSISPEQQAFAKAYRSMQLASTLFGMVIIQIKPQLEKVLNLNEDTLTKEIQLTQDLMKLFIEYQIPSDLLSFDGPKEVSGIQKIARVKSLVQEMLSLIQEKKQEEIDEANKARQYIGKGYGGYDNIHTAATSWRNEESVMECCAAATTCCYQDVDSLDGGMDMFGGGDDEECDFFDETYEISDNKSRPSEQVAVVSTSNMTKETKEASNSPTTKDEVKLSTVTNHTTTTPSSAAVSAHKTAVAVDVTKYPSLLDRVYDQYDSENAIRPGILSIGEAWRKQSKKHLLSPVTTTEYAQEDITKERQKVFTLLDALTRSGGLTIDHAAFHVIIAGVHRFDQSLLNTIIQQNKNPISRVERSYLLMASTLQDMETIELVEDAQRPRIQQDHPRLCHQ